MPNNDILYRQETVSVGTIDTCVCVICGAQITEDTAFMLIYCCPECYKVHARITKDAKKNIDKKG